MIEKLKEILIAQNIQNIDDLDEDTTFDSLHLDSIDALSMIVALETEFDISIPEDTAQNFTCARDIIDYLESIGITE